MRISLKRLNKVRKTLSVGSSRTYYYAWKGGPRLPGRPGDPEFVLAYQKAHTDKVAARERTLLGVLETYQKSERFSELAARTQSDYHKHIRKIAAEYGDFPIAALNDRRTCGEFLSWRDRLARNSRRQADYSYSVLALVLAWGFDRGMVPCNPCARPGRTYRSRRADNIWTEDDEARFIAVTPE